MSSDHRPSVSGLDHLVLTVRDLNATIIFYDRVLGCSITSFGDGRLALKFGTQKINLHVAGREYKPCAEMPTPGSADLCFVTNCKLSEWISHLEQCQVPIVEGPVPRTGALGPITSVYIRDPDLNLIGIATYDIV